MKQKKTWLYNQRPVPTKRMTLTPMSADELGELIERETDAHMKQAYTEMRDGVLQNPDDDNSVIPVITSKDYKKYVIDGTISGGMIPKIENALAAVNVGVTQVIITSFDALNSGTVIK